MPIVDKHLHETGHCLNARHAPPLLEIAWGTVGKGKTHSSHSDGIAADGKTSAERKIGMCGLAAWLAAQLWIRMQDNQ